VVAFSYPEELTSVTFSRPTEPRVVPRWLHEPTVIAAIIGLAGTLLAVIIPVWMTTRRNEPAQNHAEPPKQRSAPQPLTLDDILDVLDRHHQRATFGAVSGVLGREPISLFKGYVRSPKTAWVVNKRTGLPTGTKEADSPRGLLEKTRVIDAPDELREWLRKHH